MLDQDNQISKLITHQQDSIMNNLIANLSEMAGLKTPLFSKTFMVKLRFQTKGRLLASNPRNFYELVTAIYRSYPQIYNIEDYQIYFHDQDNERSQLHADDDLQAAYKLMSMKRTPILIFYIEHARSKKPAHPSSKSVIDIKKRSLKADSDLLENTLIIRNSYVYEFSRTSRNAYCFRCEDWRRGCKGKWYLYEKDSRGLGIEHSAHSMLREEHACMDLGSASSFLEEVGKVVEMRGELPYVVDYEGMKRVVGRMVARDWRVGVSEVVGVFWAMGTDWNLLGKRLLEGVVAKVKARLGVRGGWLADVGGIRTLDGGEFWRDVIEVEAEMIKQYVVFFWSEFQEKELRTAKTIYISGSHKKWLKPQWSETVFIQGIVNGVWVTLWTFLTQSWSEEAFKAALTHIQSTLDLAPEKIVLDPLAPLTAAAISTFGTIPKYKTVSYFFHNYLNTQAQRMNLTSDHNIKKLLWCLKSLAFQPPSQIPSTFQKIVSFYTRFCSSYAQLTTHFSSLFLSKLNLDYWNTSFLLKEPKGVQSSYLEENKLLEIHDVIVDREMGEVETWAGWVRALAETEGKWRGMVEEGLVARVEGGDLEEREVLGDLVEGRYGVEEVMGHSFRLPEREGGMGGVGGIGGIGGAMGGGQVVNFNPFNGGMGVGRRRGRMASANLYHLEGNGVPARQQEFVDEEGGQPFPSGFRMG
jgi:hypothetical protein